MRPHLTMIEDRILTPISKKIIPFTLVLTSSVILAACSSSKPSPWTESSSPWDNRVESSEVVEPVAAEPEALVLEDIEPMPIEQEVVEPIGFVPEVDDSVAVEAQAMVEEEPIALEEETQMLSGEGLSAQPAANFAVQVVASSSMDQLKFFASQHQLSDQWVAETTVDGKIWYVLMSGIFTTKADAEQALIEVQDIGTDPWIRTVGSIQAVTN